MVYIFHLNDILDLTVEEAFKSNTSLTISISAISCHLPTYRRRCLPLRKFLLCFRDDSSPWKKFLEMSKFLSNILQMIWKQFQHLLPFKNKRCLLVKKWLRINGHCFGKKYFNMGLLPKNPTKLGAPIVGIHSDSDQRMKEICAVLVEYWSF